MRLSSDRDCSTSFTVCTTETQNNQDQTFAFFKVAHEPTPAFPPSFSSSFKLNTHCCWNTVSNIIHEYEMTLSKNRSPWTNPTGCLRLQKRRTWVCMISSMTFRFSSIVIPRLLFAMMQVGKQTTASLSMWNEKRWLAAINHSEQTSNVPCLKFTSSCSR